MTLKFVKLVLTSLSPKALRGTMRPITVINLIILGSSLAISICLVVVWAILSITAMDPALAERVGPELKVLPTHIALFIPLTLICTVSFLSMQKQKPSRWFWQLAMWGALSALVFFYANNI